MRSNRPPVIKSFATVLSDHPQVNKLRTQLGTVKRNVIPPLPESFYGNIVWEQYLSPIQNQGKCGSCWSQASVGVLSDRFAIFSLNQVHKSMSSYQPLICSSVISSNPPKNPDVLSQINLQAHTSKACSGNQIQTALEYLYVYGTTSYACFNRSELDKKGYKSDLLYESPSDLPKCEELMTPDYDTCVNGLVAARYYRALTYYALNNDPQDIKYEIWKYGPVVTAFMVYDDFLSGYDGTTIYMGPKEGSAAQGGHAVRILGWGREKVDNVDVDFWVIANSWGPNWGDGGIFRMKIGIKGDAAYQIENNCFGLIPDIPTLDLSKLDLEIISDIPRELINERSMFSVDNESGFTYSGIRKTLRGELYGDLTELFDVPNLPNYNKFIASNVPLYPPIWPSSRFEDMNINTNASFARIKRKQQRKDMIYMGSTLLLSVLIGVLLRYFLYRKKK